MALSKFYLPFAAGLLLLISAENKTPINTKETHDQKICTRNNYIQENYVQEKPAIFIPTQSKLWFDTLNDLFPSCKRTKTNLEKAVDLFPTSFQIAEKLISEGNLEEALYYVSKTEKYMEMSSKNADKMLFLGDFYFALAQKLSWEGKNELRTEILEKALDNYQNAMMFDITIFFTPKLAEIHEKIGYTLLELNRKEEANRAFLNAINQLGEYKESRSFQRRKRLLERIVKEN